MSHAVNDEALDTIFRAARTHNKWQDKPVSPALLMAIYDLMRWGPTSANISPARIVFVVSKEAKERLKPHLDAGNRGQDDDRAGHRDPRLRSRFRPLSAEAESAQCGDAKTGSPIPSTPRRRHFATAALQGGYFIIAARALGLDCGPMSGFDNAGVDREFFAGTAIKSNFLCNVGYGDRGRRASRASQAFLRRGVQDCLRAGSEDSRRRYGARRMLCRTSARRSRAVAPLGGDGARPRRSAGADGRRGDARSGCSASRRSTGSRSRSVRARSPASASALPSCAGCAWRSEKPLTGVTSLGGHGRAGARRDRRGACGGDPRRPPRRGLSRSRWRRTALVRASSEIRRGVSRWRLKGTLGLGGHGGRSAWPKLLEAGP